MDRKASLLVIDDNDMNRDMLSRRLRHRGYTVTVGRNGEHALEMVRARRFDLVLLDVMMPGMNGLEVLKVLRQTHPPIELPVVMATARNGSEDVVEALGLGANDYVTKPLDFPVVLARVETHLALKRAMEQVKRLEHRLTERNGALEHANARMSRDLNAAARIQEAFLPSEMPEFEGADFSWIYRPCNELGGDGLNIIPLGRRRVGFYVLDVSGHGAVSALLSVAMSRVLAPPLDPASILVRQGKIPDRRRVLPPAAVADNLNQLFPFNPTGQFATLLYGVLDVESGEFCYVSAGHPGPVHLPARGAPTTLESCGFPIGIASDEYDQHCVHLSPGDRLYLYSDGVVEARNPAAKQFGEAGLCQTIERTRNQSLTESVDALFAATETWRGDASVQDDISILAVEFTALATVSSGPTHVSCAGLSE